MMKRRTWAGTLGGTLAVVALVAGCATPKQRCLSQATQELRGVERALDTARGNIARGYAIHTQRVPYTVAGTCYHTHPRTHAVFPYSCPSTYYRTQSTPVAINVAEERRKAENLQRRLPQMRERANAAVRQCNAQFPE